MNSSRIIRQNIRLAIILMVLALAALWLRPARARGEERVGDKSAASRAARDLAARDQAARELGAADREMPAVLARSVEPGPEKFVPGGASTLASPTLEMRGEVTLIGEEVKVKNVCRWADSDKAAFEPISDLVLFRLQRSSPFRSLTMKELREILHDAGVNLAMIRLVGATMCTVARSDVRYDEKSALDQWIAAKESGTAKPRLIESPLKMSVVGKPAGVVDGSPDVPVEVKPVRPVAAQAAPIPVPQPEERSVKTLRELLVAEMAERMGLPATELQFHFNPADERVLNLSEPLFKFGIVAPRYKNLGDVNWEVSIIAEGGSQKVTIAATVRAWQKQLIVNRPIGFRQVINESDLIERRTLVDRLSEDPLVTREQTVGQMAERDLKPGTVMTARLIEPTILVKSNQLVSISMAQGGIQAKSVARSTEQGILGQSIRVKNESTGDSFDVIVTGPQAAKMAAGPAGVPMEAMRIER